jgi:hypothetical protein
MAAHIDGTHALSITERVFSFGIASLAIVAGILLFLGRPLGLRLSVWGQALQAVVIETHTIAYQVVMGYSFTVFAHFNGFVGVSASVGDFQSWLTFGDAESPYVAVNLAALGVASFLLREIRSESISAAQVRRRVLSH